jgi:hypothetical protein
VIRLAAATAALLGTMWATGGAEADIEFSQPIPIIPITAATIPVTTMTVRPAVPVSTTATVVHTSDTLPPVTTLPGHDGALCGAWWPTAVAAGWPVDDLGHLDAVMWAESRCTPDIVSTSGDWGLAQINWTAHGDRVEALGYTRDDLLVPAVNLMVARQVFEAAEAAWWCGWEPWAASVDWRSFCTEDAGDE